MMGLIAFAVALCGALTGGIIGLWMADREDMASIARWVAALTVAGALLGAVWGVMLTVVTR